MKKKELVITALLLIVFAFFWSLSEVSRANASKQNSPSENAETGTKVKVIHDKEVLLVFDASVDGEYWFEGNYGKLMVEVKDGKWRITQEECPNHICSSIGWVYAEDYFPIVCLPNGISVEIE